MASFTTLPAELRNAIYAHLLSGTAPDLSVLRVSRQLHAEAASFLYQNNHFTITFSNTRGEEDRENGESPRSAILPPIPDRYMRYLKRLTVEVRVGASTALQAGCARALDSLTKSGARISVLRVELTSNTSLFLAERVDETVLTSENPLTLALRRLLTERTAMKVEVQLQGMWFAPGVLGALKGEFGGRLEVFSTTSGTASIERALSGCTMRSHLHDLGLEEKEIGDLQSTDTLSELDHFSPSEYLSSAGIEEETQNVDQVPSSFPLKRADSFFYSPPTTHDNAEGEEELTEEDDVVDEEMLDIDDFEAILGNLGDLAQRGTAEREICYLMNFAPEVLGRWVEDSG